MIIYSFKIGKSSQIKVRNIMGCHLITATPNAVQFRDLSFKLGATHKAEKGRYDASLILEMSI